MANYTYNCDSDKKNTGFKSYCEKIGLIKGYIITDESVDFATEAAAQVIANWTSLIQAKSAYPFSKIMELENQGDEPTYEDTPFATMLVNNGKISWKFSHAFSQPSHKAYFTHKSNTGRIYLINEKGEFKGEETSTGRFRGFKISLLNVENAMLSAGSASEKTNVKITLENAEDFNTKIVTVVPTDFSGLDLMGLIDIRIASVALAATDITLEASIFATGEPQDGFVEADFTILSSAGAAIDATTFTALGEGQYQFEGNALVAGTYTVKMVPSSMTTKGFDTPLVATIVIPA